MTNLAELYIFFCDSTESRYLVKLKQMKHFYGIMNNKFDSKVHNKGLVRIKKNPQILNLKNRPWSIPYFRVYKKSL